MTAVLQQPHPPRLKKWTKEEYLKLIERGAFDKQRIYLFRGDIIEMAPHGHEHAYGIAVLTRYLTDTFKPPYAVRIQLSFVTPGASVPEPDGAVCSAQDAARRPHPSHADLIVEVAHSSLNEDREKAAEYAAAQVPEYWIIDAERRCVEVFRRPEADRAALLGYSYSETQVLNVGDQIAPTNRPDAAVPIAVFFPS
jgi:Uma2 family endonuclease